MCGITGFASYKVNYLQKKGEYTNLIESMCDSLGRRGPDSFGYKMFDNSVLGHTRLSIIDLSTGQQPMVSDCKRYTIVYNGELYNADSLKNNLISQGAVFNTTSDTEVILNAYIYYGEQCATLFNGIFAFAIYDSVKDLTFLCRDRFGIKPLYYTIVDNEIFFASEIKAIAKSKKVDLVLDNDSISELFGLFPSRSEGNGVYKNINEIGFGEYAVFNKNGFYKRKYYQLEAEENTNTYEQNRELVKELVTDSTLGQMTSDVEISTFLSGGVDSSILTALASNKLKESGKKLTTYSFDFVDNSKYFQSNSFQPDEDKFWVKKMVENFELNHNYLMCNVEDLEELLYTATVAKDYAGMADIDSSLLYFCNIIGKQNKVALSGECADEIFGGYPWFNNLDLLDLNMFPWIRNLPTRLNLVNPDIQRKVNIEEYAKQKYFDSVAKVPTLYGESEMDKKRRTISYLNLKWFMPTLLERMDRMSMASSLEVRVPFADHRIVHLAYNIPWEHKTRLGTKGILRDAFSDLLPHDLLYRQKSPYPKTYNPNYESLLKSKLNSIIDSNNSKIIDLVDKNEIKKLINTENDINEYGKPWFGQLMSKPQLIGFYIELEHMLQIHNPKIDIK